MKKLFAIALFAVLAASSTANAWWGGGWNRGYYGYGYGCGGCGYSFGCGCNTGCGACGGWWY